MAPKKKEFQFPSKRPMKKIKDVLEAGEIKGIQVTDTEGSVLVDLPIHSDIGKVVPKAFRFPAQALGVGISTVARIFGARVLFGTKADDDKGSNEL